MTQNDRGYRGRDRGRVPLVVNRGAGAGERVLSELEAERRERRGVGLEWVEAAPDELAARIRDLLRRRPAAIAVAGGDGTHRTAAELLAGLDTALIPVPAGTLNHFARRCGIESVSESVPLLEGGRTEAVTLGVVDDRLFLNTAILGTYPELLARRNRYERRLPRWLAAALAFAITMIRGRPIDVTLERDDGPHRLRTAMIWIGLGRGSYPLSHLGEPVEQRELLEVAVLRKTGRIGVLRFLLRLVLRAFAAGDPAGDPDVEILRVRSVLIRSGKPLSIALDGERMRLEPPLFIACAPGALRVRVPVS